MFFGGWQILNSVLITNKCFDSRIISWNPGVSEKLQSPMCIYVGLELVEQGKVGSNLSFLLWSS